MMNVLHCINVYSHSATLNMCGKMAVKMNNLCLVMPFEISVYVTCMFDIHVPCSKFTSFIRTTAQQRKKTIVCKYVTLLLHVWVYKWPSSGYRLSEVRQWNICKCPIGQINLQLFSLMGILPEDGHCRLKHCRSCIFINFFI